MRNMLAVISARARPPLVERQVWDDGRSARRADPIEGIVFGHRLTSDEEEMVGIVDWEGKSGLDDLQVRLDDFDDELEKLVSGVEALQEKQRARRATSRVL